ncbi:MAG: aconitate hydratase AcnA [Myxococcales bacterium]|nr:MAG: aconitate hydratase AcnA [Myxococcales bacterium]
MRVLLENLLRFEDGVTVSKEDIEAVAKWDPKAEPDQEIAYRPSRVLLQDFTGVPAVVDLAAMREAYVALGGKAEKITPLQPADLVIDHSVQVDFFGTPAAFEKNVQKEVERNIERYQFLKWGQQAFESLRVVPPGTGIVHQVNLEYLAPVVFVQKKDGQAEAYPDSLVGTDSHTTMINGLGVLGWGVGGIEAEAAMLGQPVSMLVPQVVGFRLKGKAKEGVTATDVVLTVTQMLRSKGVVGKFVEFFGPGLDGMPLPDRATIANMAPEYGATMGFFPVDQETLTYLRLTGRKEEDVAFVEAYTKAQHLFRDSSAPEPEFTDTLELDLSTVEACISGPKRPQDRIALSQAKTAWQNARANLSGKAEVSSAEISLDGQKTTLHDGSVAIAAITSCTNTSNPAVLVAAGLLAKKAIERGLKSKAYVKTSLAPGSQVVTDYLNASGLMKPLEQLGFNLVGYGCTTCIGNSGPVDDAIAAVANDVVLCSVLSGNRNFEGRINPSVRANYLASPPLVVAYAIAGNMDFDFQKDALGKDSSGNDVFLKDIWPSNKEVADTVGRTLKGEMFERRYAHVLKGDTAWQAIQSSTGAMFEWQSDSTYIRKPPFFEDMEKGQAFTAPGPIKGARLLALLGDSVTTDHISPAGSIAADSPAARYLEEHGVARKDFNSYGSRRGNHEVMMRGTFANIRLRNQLAPGTEGGVTRFVPSGEQMSIFDAAMQYQAKNIPLLIIAGKEYGTGSSRDWAAKGTMLLGVKAVIAESYERIHRSNLIGMGVLPLEFVEKQNAASLGLTGEEEYSIEGIAAEIKPAQRLTVQAGDKKFDVRVRIDTPQEAEYYKSGGILRHVLRQL